MCESGFSRKKMGSKLKEDSSVVSKGYKFIITYNIKPLSSIADWEIFLNALRVKCNKLLVFINNSYGKEFKILVSSTMVAWTNT